MKKIVLRRADLKEYTIAERDFKYLYPSDFEDLYLLNLQGTLQQIDEALDYRVKEFKVNRINPGLNTRFWKRKDVDISKEFMFAIQKRLKTRNLPNPRKLYCLKDREGDYRCLREPNDYIIRNHGPSRVRSVLTDPEVHAKIEMEIPRSSGVNSQPHANT
ncbi:hypothetical protein Tco_0866217 [Tanacetum coccineum]